MYIFIAIHLIQILGWDIARINTRVWTLASHVLFTYICPETKKPFPSLCSWRQWPNPPLLVNMDQHLSNVKNGVSYEDLSSIIMNLFDLYTHSTLTVKVLGCHNVEAAACGVPVCGTDYSAMESEILEN